MPAYQCAGLGLRAGPRPRPLSWPPRPPNFCIILGPPVLRILVMGV